MAVKGGFDLKYVFHPNSLGVVPVEKNTPGELATAGYFEEAAGFLPGEGEVLQLQLLGVTQPATAVGTRVRVQIQGLDEPESWRKLQCFFGKFFHGLNPPYLSKSIGKMYVFLICLLCSVFFL
jgi:hypothetical protein